MTYAKRVFLKNGLPVSLRPLKASDVDLLEEMHHQLSPQTIYNRYLRHHVPTRDEIEAMCNLPAEKGTAFIAVIEAPTQRAIGMGYYVIDGHGEYGEINAEPALIVDDVYQGQGLGGHLFNQLCEDAVQHGVGQFSCYLHTSNEACLKLIRRSGYSYQGRYSYGTRELYMDLRGEQVLW